MNYAPPPRYGRSDYGMAASRPAINDALWVTYRWMTLGLGLTGLVAMLVASSPAVLSLVFGTPLMWVLLIAQIGLVMAFSVTAHRLSTGAAAAMFLGYAALTGVTLSSIFIVYTAGSIATTFFVTAGAYAGLSLFGLFTKSDLSAVGRFAIFALFGIILASLVNIFLQSAPLEWMMSIGGVLVFGALTAYDTQKLRDMFASGEVHGNMPLVGALTLYLDFINLFLFLLRLLGRSRD